MLVMSYKKKYVLYLKRLQRVIINEIFLKFNPKFQIYMFLCVIVSIKGRNKKTDIFKSFMSLKQDKNGSKPAFTKSRCGFLKKVIDNRQKFAYTNQ